jgi:hypothetical protein
MINKKKAIITSHDCPPIPLRGADWSARFEWYGPDEEDQPVGLGETESKAVLDLLVNGSTVKDDGSIIEALVDFAYVGACIDLGIDQ